MRLGYGLFSKAHSIAYIFLSSKAVASHKPFSFELAKSLACLHHHYARIFLLHFTIINYVLIPHKNRRII